MTEFLVRIEISLAPDMAPEQRESLQAAEAARGRELREAGTIARMWRVPGQLANVGIWNAADATELHEALSSLPLFNWMSVRVEPLAKHHLEAGDA